MKLEKNFPSVVKYMGSKTEVLKLIEKSINRLDRDYAAVCDLFAGSATMSAALRNKVNVISNDIQNYSKIFAHTYFNNYCWDDYPDIKDIHMMAEERYKKFNDYFKEYDQKFSYNKELTLEELNLLEQEQRELINKDNWNEFDDYYLFTKYYSGTYWSYDQCIWIDSYKYAIDKYDDMPEYHDLLLTCLIYAMAYNSQSTGHYAQYRVPETESSKEDILIYRKKNITEFFIRKYEELKGFTSKHNDYTITTTSMTDLECLKLIPNNTLVYADPPYCFVHYSRFYHVLETLVRYDYPTVKHKGRYRDDRYQSGYCIKTEVVKSFSKMFQSIKKKEADLILSYSNSETNTIDFNELIRICCKTFNNDIDDMEIINRVNSSCDRFFKNKKSYEIVLDEMIAGRCIDYEISIMKMPYSHSRMGRKNAKTIKVTEIIILAKKIN